MTRRGRTVLAVLALVAAGLALTTAAAAPLAGPPLPHEAQLFGHPDPGQAGANFGQAVSVFGNTALVGAITGAFGGFGLQYWMNVYAQPILIGGKPLNSYPAFVPVTFEPGILLTAFSCLIGMLALNGLPRLYHAVFKSRNFHRATDNGFFIGIEARDPKFNESDVKKLLEGAGGRNIEVLED